MAAAGYSQETGCGISRRCPSPMFITRIPRWSRRSGNGGNGGPPSRALNRAPAGKPLDEWLLALNRGGSLPGP